MKFGRIPTEKLLIYSYWWQMNIGFDDDISIRIIWLKQQYYINIHALCETSRKLFIVYQSSGVIVA